jgi:hypothetical protein
LFSNFVFAHKKFKISIKLLISAISGTFFKIVFHLFKSDAQIIGSAAFFDPEICTSPESFDGHFIINFDIKSFFIKLNYFKKK